MTDKLQSDPRLQPSPRGVWIYATTLGVIAAGTATSLILAGADTGPALVVIGLAAAAAFAERSSVRLSATVDESISALPMLFAAVLFGPLAALIVASASMLGDFTRPYLVGASTQAVGRSQRPSLVRSPLRQAA